MLFFNFVLKSPNALTNSVLESFDLLPTKNWYELKLYVIHIRYMCMFQKNWETQYWFLKAQFGFAIAFGSVIKIYSFNQSRSQLAPCSFSEHQKVATIPTFCIKISKTIMEIAGERYIVEKPVFLSLFLSSGHSTAESSQFPHPKSAPFLSVDWYSL